ncbi:MAG TPA: beta-N-acetylhexosaminidase, partial [Pontiellaceae bacterium]|nr:beta-N-acetylhexosaminidase [Pontiellaceae bacterium]
AAAGLFYGAQTLRQLLPPEIYSPTLQQKPWVAPRIEICDRPEFRWRGLHLDVSRHFMPKEDIFRFLDVMASLKLNTFHWHLTDDQGWRIEIKKYPKLTDVGAWRDRTLIGHARDKVQQYDNQRYGGFYTQEDVREVVAYAAARQITVVPEIDMPGHMQAAVAAYPELGCTADPVPVKTDWGVSANILNPEESTVEFCKNVLTEIIDLFPSEYIHIGGDEADKSKWKQSPRIQQLMKERGLADMHQMQSWFIRQIDDFLTAKGRRLIGWDEIADGGLARNGTLMWWRKAAGKTAEAAAQGGQDVVIAVTEYLYFDFYYSAERENEPLAIGGNLPLQKVYAFAPIPKQWSPAAASHVLGAQGQLWTEYIKDMRQVEYMAFPRACALSEAVWSPSEGKGYADFLRRIRVQEQRFSAAGVNFRREP